MATSDKPLIFHRHALHQEKKDATTLPCQEVAFDRMTSPHMPPERCGRIHSLVPAPTTFFLIFYITEKQKYLCTDSKIKKKTKR
jgi:hypothetical protein